MQPIFVGIVGLIAGALVALYGVRVFYLLLPLWGFVAGALIGAQAVADIFGDGFLASFASWAVAIVLGVVFAVTATLWFWAAVLILAFGVGAEIGSGIALALGFGPGILPFAAGIALGAVLVVVAIAVDAPVILVAALSALGGAALIMDGGLLLLGAIAPADLADGAIAALRGDPLLVAGWLVLAVLSFAYQLLDAAGGHLGLRTRLDRTVA
jgi:hypothetical protein